MTTIEIVVAVSLFGFVLVGLAGLHMVAISAGKTAETSSIAANLARARMEELLALPPARVVAQHNAEAVQQVGGQGRIFTVHTTVDASDPAHLDLTVTVTWQVAHSGACARAGSDATCTGNVATHTRTLQTRILGP